MSIPVQTPASVLVIPLVAAVETALGLGVATVIRTATAWMTAALTSGTSVHHLVSVFYKLENFKGKRKHSEHLQMSLY